jgi:glycosyltransferase involved in cell wall biosynthesis
MAKTRGLRVGIDARKIADFGIGTYIRGLLRGLVELGGDERYVAFAPAHVEVPAGVEHIIIDAPHYSLRELVAIGLAANEAQLEVLHAPHYVTPFTRVPLVVTIHDLIHLHQPLRNPLAKLYARTMIGRAVRNSARVLTVSETVKRELIDSFDCDPQKMIVTPNGIDARFSPGERTAAEWPYLLYVGNDKPHKRVDLLVEAFEEARRSLPELTLVLAGSPFARFAGRATLRGFVDDAELPALYRNALALVLPSVEEGFGLPAAEAMACGTPVITSTAASLVEITGDAALHARSSSRGVRAPNERATPTAPRWRRADRANAHVVTAASAVTAAGKPPPVRLLDAASHHRVVHDDHGFCSTWRARHLHRVLLPLRQR